MDYTQHSALSTQHSPEPELIADYACVTGEGPLWHPTEQRVYWTDIPQGRLFRYDPTTGRHEQIYQGEVVGGFYGAETCRYLAVAIFGAQALVILISPAVELARQPEMVTEAKACRA